MKNVLALALILGLWAPCPRAQMPANRSPEKDALASAGGQADRPALPPPPRGKSTILGGEIRNIDPVRDELILKTYGVRPLKILFDERTQVYRDGVKIPLHDLKPADHASIQTLLDGTDVFALSIHILSQSPEGEYQGRVISFDPSTDQLMMSSVLFREPIKLLVPSSASVVRVGQPGFTATHPGTADLIRGALITARFQSDKQGRGVVSNISVLATPGADFVFIGNISSLDTHTGILSLVDPQDDKVYEVSFDSASIAGGKTLRMGDHIIVTAAFDGTNYRATAITVDN
jgi:hypothetical protein